MKSTQDPNQTLLVSMDFYSKSFSEPPKPWVQDTQMVRVWVNLIT